MTAPLPDRHAADSGVSWSYRLPNCWGGRRYAIHEALWIAFPHGLPSKQAAPFLFRVETDSVLVRSRTEPLGIKARVEAPSWAPGDLARLDLHLNVHKRHGGQNLPVLHGDVLPFVLRILGRMGVEVVDDDLSILPFAVQQHDRVPLFPVRVDALVKVQDADAVRRALVHGVGRAKYLGFGMPLLSRQ